MLDCRRIEDSSQWKTHAKRQVDSRPDISIGSTVRAIHARTLEIDQTFPGEIIAVQIAVGTGDSNRADSAELVGNSNRVFPDADADAE